MKELERRSLESENSDFNMGARCLLCQLLVGVDILLTQTQDSLHPMQSHMLILLYVPPTVTTLVVMIEIMIVIEYY